MIVTKDKSLCKVFAATVTGEMENFYSLTCKGFGLFYIGHGSAWCGHLTVTQEKQVGSNPICPAILFRFWFSYLNFFETLLYL